MTKNTELKKEKVSSGHVKKGSVKQKSAIKLKKTVGKTKLLNLSPKTSSSNLNPQKSKKNKYAIQDDNKECKGNIQKIANGGIKSVKKLKNKFAIHDENKECNLNIQKIANDGIKNVKQEVKKLKKIKKKTGLQSHVPLKTSEGGKIVEQKTTKLQKKKPIEILQSDNIPSKSVAGVKIEKEKLKIEKKKRKKLAKKIKKQQQKAENDHKKKTIADSTNGVQTPKEAQATVTKDVAETNNKVLNKKIKKAAQRLLIKKQSVNEIQSRDPAQEAATVFVGNLPVNVNRIHLVRLFKDFAPINSIRLRTAGGKVIYKRKQRKSAGSLIAYVVLKNKETAERALSLNGVELKSHHLRITLAAEKPQNNENEEAKKTVFVGNLKYSATEESLREIFSSCGEIDYVRCLRDGDKGCKGVAYVRFKTADAVGLALELNKTIVDERPINVERFSVKKLGAKEAREAQAEQEEKSKKGAKRRIDDKGKKGNHFRVKKLGAKEARIDQSEQEQKSEEEVKRRIDGKKGKKEKSVDKNNGNHDDPKMKKKSEFRGVKVEVLKKKLKSKKKKTNDQMLQLAKKIAPKISE